VLVNTAIRTSYLAFHYIIFGMLYERSVGCKDRRVEVNPLNPELNLICYLLSLLGAHHFFHVSRIRVKSLTLRQRMSYIYIYVL